MKTYEDFLEDIKSNDEETMYRQFESEYTNNYQDFQNVQGDYESFKEDENDDRRRISEEVIIHLPSGTTFKVITRINNDPCGNFNVMDFNIDKVTKSTKIIEIYS